MMSNQKIRIRFRKTGDLRWISHRDLARAFERLFRRTGVPLTMSEGFHPHARINFPSALAVGIVGENEWVEVIVGTEVSAEIHQELVEQAPPGLEILDVAILESSHPKPVLEWARYEVDVPSDQQTTTQAAIKHLLDQEEYLITRDKTKQPIDLRASLIELELQDGRLQFSLRASRIAQARPRDILDAIGLSDLEQRGRWLTRTEVHLQETTN